MSTTRVAWVVPLFFILGVVFGESGSKGYLLTGPKQLLPGSTEIFCLYFQGVESAGRVTFYVRHTDGTRFGYDRRIDPKTRDYDGCVAIYLWVPSILPRGAYESELQVTWDDPKTELVIRESKEIYVSHARDLLQLIQTDKPWYTPGQLVRFRALTLNYLLKAERIPLKRIWCTDPDDTIVAEWTNFTVEPYWTNVPKLGLVEREIQLSPVAVQGVWRIHVENDYLQESKEFEVKEFVLPRFEVTIVAPHSVVHHAETFNFSVCAQSTTDEPIRGQVDVVAKVLPRLAWFGPTLSDPVAEPVKISGTLDKDTGCHQIVFPLSTVGLGGELWNTIEIVGHVTVDGTAEKRNATFKVKVAPEGGSHVFIDTYSRSPSTFKLGLPYLGQGFLHETGNAPVANASVSICVKEGYQDLNSTSGDPVQASEVPQCGNVTTNDAGRFAYSFLPQNPAVVRLSIVAKYVDESKNISSTQLTSAKPSYSASGSFALIPSLGPQEPVACDSKLTVKVYFNKAEPSQTLRLRYFVTARGDIVANGTKSQDDIKTVDVELPGVLDGTKSPVQVNEVELEIEVKPSFYPKAAVLVYYVREDGELVTAQTEFTVADCYPNPVTLKWNAPAANPGTTTGLNLHSTPESLCGLSVVDQSVALLKPEGQLTEKSVLEQLKAFTIESYVLPRQATFDYQYCEENKNRKPTSTLEPEALNTRAFEQDYLQEKEPDMRVVSGADEPEEESQDNTSSEPPAADLNGVWSSSSFYQDPIEAFDGAGLLVMSNWKMQTRPCHDYFTEHRDVILNGMPEPISAPGRRPEAVSSPTESEEVNVPIVEEHVYFPETLLWDLYTTDDNGDAQVEQRLPNKTTSWVGRAFCLSYSTGFGMSAETKITAVRKN